MGILPRGEPVDIEALGREGVSPFLASYLARNGWLQHLSRGTYLLRGDQVTRDGALNYLAKRVPGLHVGSKTALDWQGVRHNVAMRERLDLWGDKSYRLPAWLTQRFNCHYQTTHLFDDGLPKDYGLKRMPASSLQALVSVPERAMLEMLSDVGKRQSLEEARYLLECLRPPRPEVLQRLLSHCTRIKVVRLALHMADELGLDWVDLAREQSEKMGSDRRWMVKMKSGEILSLKKRLASSKTTK